MDKVRQGNRNSSKRPKGRFELKEKKRNSELKGGAKCDSLLLNSWT